MFAIDSRGQVVLIGATNKVDAMDGALHRPGRFDLCRLNSTSGGSSMNVGMYLTLTAFAWFSGCCLSYGGWNVWLCHVCWSHASG
ncbi:uncharacterized protein [Euphorbia lathyris]|uniref:uncharacterized protein n=1 Tax=Euphorbia lathyris TaxID=212925 RepID=UPI0033139D50